MNTTLWPDFHEAFVHTERGGHWHQRVMGRRLRPFCAYHAHWLEVVGSPLWRNTGQRATLADLDLATKICASDYREAADAVRRPGRIEKWAFAARVVFRSRQFEAWTAYMTDYLSPPHRTNKTTKLDATDAMGRHGLMKKDQKISKSGRDYADMPDVLMLVAGLMHLGRCSAREAWMMPFSEAEWLLCALHSQAGREINVSGEHDREFMQGLLVGPWSPKKASLP